MRDKIDCLLLGYSGLDKTSKEYVNLIKKNPDIKRIPTTLNSAITYLGTALDKRGLSFDFVNAIEDDFELIIEKVRSKRYFSIGLSTTICPNIPHLINFVKILKRLDQDIKIILGGALIVYNIRDLLEDDENVFYETFKELKADYIIDSIYGEDKLASLIYNLKNNRGDTDIPNLYVRRGDEFICDLKEKEVYHLEENRVNWKLFKGKTGGSVVVRTSLSCCFKCTFCSFPVRAGRFKATDLDGIEMELNEIESLGEVKLVHFIDDTFNVPLSRFKKILRMFIHNKYTFKWHCFIRCQDLDEEAVQLMVESGCIGVFLGLESGNNDVLKVMNKESKVEDYKRGIALLKKYNIIIVASFFAGFPGETVQSLKDTYRFIEEIGAAFYYLGLWFYDPYTPITKQKEAFGLVGKFYDWKHKGMNSEMTNKLITQMKSSIKNATLLEQIHYPFLFQVINTNIDIATLKNYFDSNRTSNKNSVKTYKVGAR